MGQPADQPQQRSTDPSGLIHQDAARRHVLATGRPGQWRSVDILTAAMLGVAGGVLFIGWDYLLNAWWEGLAIAFPPARSLIMGIWLLPAVAGALLIRRPGAALLVELIAALLEFMLGNPWGAGVLVSALLQGLGAEAVVAALRWRRWGVPVAMAAGAGSAALAVICFEWWSYMAAWSWSWKLAGLGAAVISGLLLAGLGAHAVVRALAAAGAVNALPPGQEALLRRGDPLHDAFPAVGE